MKKFFINKVSIFLKIEITDFGVPFIPYADTITELPQASECLMSAPDFWTDSDTSAGYGTRTLSELIFFYGIDGVTCHQ